jgi:predicted transcriptional regulator of viral defense system
MVISSIQKLTSDVKYWSGDGMKAGISAAGREELARVTGRGRRFLTVKNVARTLGIDDASASYKLARWTREGWLRRVRRGLYIPVPVDAEDPSTWSEDPMILAAEVWSPCYFTGWTAANHWSLTEQVFRTTVVKTSCRVRTSTPRLMEHEYLLTHVPERHLTWGLETLWVAERRLSIADPARTVVDVLDDPRLGGGIRHVAEVLAAYLEEHDPSLLVDHGDRLGNRAVFKRLGYLLVTTGHGDSSLVDACRSRVSAGMSALDPLGPSGGRYLREWGLRVNVRVAEEGAS